jgi:hypothetical protein
MNIEIIKELCDRYAIKNYTINDDMSIDVNDNVYLENMLGSMTELPLKFNRVYGYFNCNRNNLRTLKGSPKYVGGSFDCSYNRLYSLEYSPIHVEDYWSRENNHITSLEGLENTHIQGWLNASSCNNLYCLEGFPKSLRFIYIYDTPIKPIYDKYIDSLDLDVIRRFNKLGVISTDGAYWYMDYDQLGKYFRSIDMWDSLPTLIEFERFVSTTRYSFY